MPPALCGLLIAVALDAFLGDPPNRFHPVAVMGSFIGWGSRSAAGGKVWLFAVGVAILITGCALFSLPWLVIFHFSKNLPWWLQGVIMGIALKPTFALRRLLEAGRDIRQAIERGDLPDARRLLSWHLVSRETASLSADLACSAVVESLTENFTDSFLAPLLCFAIGGVPLAWLYRFVNTADSMIGFRTSRYEYLGKAAARFDDAMNYLPARLGGLILVASAALCGLAADQSWKVMVKVHGKTRSPNAGWTMAAAAGALGVKLQKVGFYVLDGGGRLPQCRDVRRASRLVLVGAALGFIACGGIAYGIRYLP